MNIETVIEWLTTTNSLGVPNYCNVSTWVIAAILWGVVIRRWVVGRRKKRVSATTLTLDRAYTGPGKYDVVGSKLAVTVLPAPDRQYQGDQVSGIRKELLALEERVGKLEHAEYKAKTAPVPLTPQRIRVFQYGLWHRLFCGTTGYVRMVWGWGETAAPLPEVERWAEHVPSVTELPGDSPEYREIVASFEAWRKGQ